VFVSCDADRLIECCLLLQNVAVKAYIEGIASVPGQSLIVNAGFEVLFFTSFFFC
jgi:hypothetical protein